MRRSAQSPGRQGPKTRRARQGRVGKNCILETIERIENVTKYQEDRNTRRSYRNLVGKLRGGKLYPIMAEAVRPSEGGMISQQVTMMLDPIPGRLITDITAEFYAVFAPAQAIDAIKDPGAAYAGLTDVVREKMLSGTPLFGLEVENEIFQAVRRRPPVHRGRQKGQRDGAPRPQCGGEPPAHAQVCEGFFAPSH